MKKSDRVHIRAEIWNDQISIREWFKKKDGTWTFTPKGFLVDPDLAKDFLAGVTRAVRELAEV